jgi:hypothetical protein
MKHKIIFDTDSENYQESDLWCAINGLNLALALLVVKNIIPNKLKHYYGDDKSHDYNEGYIDCLEEVNKEINECLESYSLNDTLNSIR